MEDQTRLAGDGAMDKSCLLKVPTELYAAFAEEARVRGKTIEWMLLEFMRATVASPVSSLRIGDEDSRSSLVRDEEDKDAALIIRARAIFATWRDSRGWLDAMSVGDVLVKMRGRAERRAGTRSGRGFAMAMHDLLKRSGLEAIDKRTRSDLINCFKHAKALAAWRNASPKRRALTEPRKVWREYRTKRARNREIEAASRGRRKKLLSEAVSGIIVNSDDASSAGMIEASLTRLQVPNARPALKNDHPVKYPMVLRVGLTSDNVAAWFAEYCEFGELWTAWLGELYVDYAEWLSRAYKYHMGPHYRKLFMSMLVAHDPDRIRLLARPVARFGETVKRVDIVSGMRLKADPFYQWLAVRCELGSSLLAVTRALWWDFRSWLIEGRGNGFVPTEQVFVARLSSIQGVHRSPNKVKLTPGGGSAARMFRGIALKKYRAPPPWEDALHL
jgi:hypothetical protein